MAQIKVDRPPIITQVVDLESGKPTREFAQFLRQLWERSGGFDDNNDFIYKLLSTERFHRKQQVEQGQEKEPNTKTDSLGGEQSKAIDDLQRLALAFSQNRQSKESSEVSLQFIQRQASDSNNLLEIIGLLGKSDQSKISKDIQQALAYTVPQGGIIMWTGETVPDGWALCDGSNGTPDLRERFVYGAGGSVAMNTTFGAFIFESATDPAAVNISLNTAQVAAGTDVDAVTGITVDTHSHDFTVNVSPPSYALAFIMKL